MIDLWIRDKYDGEMHKIGTNPHDELYVDDEGTVHYHNLQNGDGCIGYKSLNNDKDIRGNYMYGYEFVPNMDDYGYAADLDREEGEQNES